MKTPKKQPQRAKAHSIPLHRLYNWYKKNHRKLPFRKTREPYSIWVSEIMLQQTRVAAMLPRYAAFMNEFPDVQSLANATEEEVVQAWQGLGYYSRARNLRKGARHVVSHNGGVFPTNYKAALEVPGIGPYTAAAILSIAHNQKIPVIDGNVKRVLARLFYTSPDNRARVSGEKQIARIGQKEAWFQKNAERLIARSRDPSLHNQAMMELGALVCIPGRPLCERCPLQKACGVFRKGGAEKARLVPLPERESRLDVSWRFFALRARGRDERYYLVKDPSVPFLKGHWLFPSILRIPGRPVYQTTGFEEPEVGSRAWPTVKHSITRHNIRAELIVVSAGDSKVPPDRGAGKSARPQTVKIPENGAEWQAVRRSDLGDWMASSLALKLARLIEKE